MRCGFLKYDKMRALLEAKEGVTSGQVLPSCTIKFSLTYLSK